MNILVLGGDGFCGWPTALHLSKLGHKVGIVDNLSRRKIDVDLESASLTPITPLSERLEAWHKVTGERIQSHRFDLAKDYSSLLTLLKELSPDAVVHFAEQRSAPYSMKSAAHKQYTVDNNINATHNLLSAIVESGLDIHVVHLGTMGVYGYASTGFEIPEGYLPVSVMQQDGSFSDHEILYPPQPGSVYHLTKAQDQLLFLFYNRNDDVRITDLHQGIVWGTQTEETRLHPNLINRFDYDGDYGTVLNRFLMQAAIDYPLTVYGTGGQTRAFIHIRDTVKCIALALSHPPRASERVRIYNQLTETRRIRELAQIIKERTGASINFLPNPRNEPEANELHAAHRGLPELGLVPITLSAGLMDEVSEIAMRYAQRCNRRKIPYTTRWRKSSMQQSRSEGRGLR